MRPGGGASTYNAAGSMLPAAATAHLATAHLPPAHLATAHLATAHLATARLAASKFTKDPAQSVQPPKMGKGAVSIQVIEAKEMKDEKELVHSQVVEPAPKFPGGNGAKSIRTAPEKKSGSTSDRPKGKEHGRMTDSLDMPAGYKAPLLKVDQKDLQLSVASMFTPKQKTPQRHKDGHRLPAGGARDFRLPGGKFMVPKVPTYQDYLAQEKKEKRRRIILGILIAVIILALTAIGIVVWLVLTKQPKAARTTVKMIAKTTRKAE